MNLNSFIGGRIRHFRKLKGLTQKELGQKINKNANTISQYENGLNAPSQDALFDLAAALDVRLDDFFPVREKSEDLHEVLNVDDEFSIQQMDSFKELTAVLNSLDDKGRRELLSRIDMALSIALGVTKNTNK